MLSTYQGKKVIREIENTSSNKIPSYKENNK